MSWIKGLGRYVLGDYQPYRIYSYRPASGGTGSRDAGVRRIDDPSLLSASPHREIQSLSVYAGEDAYGYGCWVNDELVSVCWYWAGARYHRERGFWSLEDNEAKLVQISTAAAARGQGLARRLVLASAVDMAERGYDRLFARIWHSNLPSIRLFEKCGWKYVAFVLEIYPLKIGRRLRFVRNKKGATQ